MLAHSLEQKYIKLKKNKKTQKLMLFIEKKLPVGHSASVLKSFSSLDPKHTINT